MIDPDPRIAGWAALVGRPVTVTVIYTNGRTDAGRLIEIADDHLVIEADGKTFTAGLVVVASLIPVSETGIHAAREAVEMASFNAAVSHGAMGAQGAKRVKAGHEAVDDIDKAIYALQQARAALVTELRKDADEREAHEEIDAQAEDVGDGRKLTEAEDDILTGEYRDEFWDDVDREYAAMEEHPGPEVAKAEAAYRGETPPKYAMLAPDAPQVYAEMLKAVEQTMAEIAAKNAAHTYGATYVPDETDESDQADEVVASADPTTAEPVRHAYATTHRPGCGVLLAYGPTAGECTCGEGGAADHYDPYETSDCGCGWGAGCEG